MVWGTVHLFLKYQCCIGVSWYLELKYWVEIILVVGNIIMFHLSGPHVATVHRKAMRAVLGILFFIVILLIPVVVYMYIKVKRRYHNQYDVYARSTTINYDNSSTYEHVYEESPPQVCHKAVTVFLVWFKYIFSLWLLGRINLQEYFTIAKYTCIDVPKVCSMQWSWSVPW